MKRFKHRRILIQLSALLSFTLPASSAIATTIINNSGQAVSISNGLVSNGTASVIQSGASFTIPSSWGDSQQVYAQITVNGSPICGNKYGIAKLPAAENQEITASLSCQTYSGSVTPPVESPIITPPVIPPSSNTLRSYGNGTWIYDAQFTDGPDGKAYTKAGLWANNLNNYNTGAATNSKISQFFTYGGDLEMYCRGSGGALITDACNSKNMLVNYFPPSFYNTNLTLAQLGDSGYSSTAAYKNSAILAQTSTKVNPHIIPIVDGRLDNPASSDYLSALNILPQAEAEQLADNVARVFCADNAVDGVQFDIEPFDFTKSGQQFFYNQIAKDFAGENKDSTGADRFSCKNVSHPNGRSFSVFTFPSKVNAKFVQTMEKHSNGYAIYSLYDLPENASVGPVNSPSSYYTLVRQQITLAVNSGAYFQLAIPAAASVHEFESLNGKATGYSQLDYVKQAIKAINDSGVRSNPRFIGIDVWGWSKYMSYPPHSTNVYSPSAPPASVLQYLQQNL